MILIRRNDALNDAVYDLLYNETSAKMRRFEMIENETKLSFDCLIQRRER